MSATVTDNEVLDALENDVRVFPELTLHDRCDACSQHAVSQILVGDTILHFCGHHTRKNLASITERGYLANIPEDYAYQYTGREIAARPVEHSLRDAGSAV